MKTLKKLRKYRVPLWIFGTGWTLFLKPGTIPPVINLLVLFIPFVCMLWLICSVLLIPVKYLRAMLMWLRGKGPAPEAPWAGQR